jgi:hypothetical protein
MGLQMASRQPPSQQQPSAYSPRRSTRVDENAVELTPDGDTWQEKICVCEGLGGKDGKTPRLVLKSYYRNNRTLQKVWDEPPTGASKVRYASSQDRRKAEAQLKELQSTLSMIPAESAPSSSSPKKERGGVGLLLGVFRRNKQKPALEPHDAQDVNLQKAIARSMADHRRPHDTSNTSASSAGSLESPRVHYDPERRPAAAAAAAAGPRSGTNPFEELDDDEEAALAEALSLSLAESRTSSVAATHAPAQTHDASSLSEDELLQLAIMESQRMAEQGQAGRASRRDSPRRNSRHRHERNYESRYESPQLMPSESLELLQDDVESGNRKPAARKREQVSVRHSNSRSGVADDHHQHRRKEGRVGRKVTRAKDPPADPPSQFMEDDCDEEVDFDELYNTVNDGSFSEMKRAPTYQRGSLFGRAPSDRKGY